jgi:hypothetical protein
MTSDKLMYRIFALHASGYDTVEFYDEDAEASEDMGLLSWLNGSVSLSGG